MRSTGNEPSVRRLPRLLPVAIAGTAVATLLALATPAVQARAQDGTAHAAPDALHAPGQRADVRPRAASTGSDDQACRISGPDEEHWNIDHRAFQASLGVLKASMIFVDFPDHPAVPAEADPASSYGPSLVSFAKKWLQENSGGKLSLDVKYDDQWLRMSKPAAAYGFADGLTYDEHRAYIKEAVRLADRAGFDFDGRRMVYVIAAPTGGALPDSPAWLGGPDGAISADDGATSIAWGATGGDDLRETYQNFGAHVLAHETMHTLGLPDLYQLGVPYSQTHQYVGAWDLMGNIAPGQDLMTWHKRQLGWLDAGQWQCVGYGQTLQADLTPDAAADGGVKTLMTPISPSAAIVAEVRTPVGFDKGMCDPVGGVLVYRVDADVPSGEGPIRVQPAHQGSTEGCGDLSFAPYKFGDPPFEGDGVKVEVVGQQDGTYTVRMTNTVEPPCPKGTSEGVVCKSRPDGGLIFTGTSGADTMVGTGADDLMRGRGGRDVIRGRGGDDQINGGKGNDRLSGNGGNDTLTGKSGKDSLSGGKGNDTLVGGKSKDSFVGGPGRDTINAHGQRHENVNCGSGRDKVTGARGDHVHRNCERVRR